MSTKRILAFTGIRSDYDLMSGLYRAIHAHPHLELGLIVTGAHLSPTYGSTIQWIEKDLLPIVARIENLLDSDKPSSRLKSNSILIQSCLHHVEQFNPDVILYPGDREDAMAAAQIGAYLAIPTIHFFGGDHSTDGNVDNPVRHAISKLSSLHFVSHKSHEERLLKMGESSKRIFLVGSPALDKFLEESFQSKKNILRDLNRPDWEDYAVVIHHPLITCIQESGQHFEEILLALKRVKMKAFVSHPNIDAGNKQILSMIEKYKNDPDFIFYTTLNRNHFVNLLRHASLMIGNSSAGLMEAPSIPLGVINVGSRQKGRFAEKNVIFVDPDINSIIDGIEKVRSGGFQEQLTKVKSPYGKGDSVKKCLQLLEELNYSDYQYKREDPLCNEL